MAMRDFNAHGPHLKKLSNHNIEAMTTIDKVYCVPKGEEWDIFGLIPLTGHKVMWLGGEPTLVSGTFNDRTEIPVTHFLDLLHDRIAGWRLEELGFNNPFGDTYTLRLEHDWNGVIVTRTIRVICGVVSVNGDEVSVTAFTDLMALIRMLTPPTEKP